MSHYLRFGPGIAKTHARLKWKYKEQQSTFKLPNNFVKKFSLGFSI